MPYLGVCHALRPPQTRCLLETWIWYSLPGTFRSELLCLLFMDVSVVWALSQCCRKLRMASYFDCSGCWNKCYFRTGYDLHIQNRLRIPVTGSSPISTVGVSKTFDFCKYAAPAINDVWIPKILTNQPHLPLSLKSVCLDKTLLRGHIRIETGSPSRRDAPRRHRARGRRPSRSGNNQAVGGHQFPIAREREPDVGAGAMGRSRSGRRGDWR